MEGIVKIFHEEEEKIEDTINEFIRNYRFNKYIELTPVHTSRETIKGNNYMMIPNSIKAMVSFKCEKCSEETVKDINHSKEIKLQVNDWCKNGLNLRKNLETGELMFWVIDEYIDINEVFDIRINKEIRRVFVCDKFSLSPTDSYSRFRCKLLDNQIDLNSFMYEFVTSKLEEIYFK